MKKILAVAIVLLAVCVTISAVSANEGFNFDFSSSDSSDSNGGSLKLDNNKLNIQGIEFTIPDGYKEDEGFKELAMEADQKAFPGMKVTQDRFNKTDDDCIVFEVVFSDDKLDTYTPADDMVAKKIGNQDGYLKEYDEGVSYIYLKDGKLVSISAKDENVIADLLK